MSGEELHEWACPSCGATTRARMADRAAGAARDLLVYWALPLLARARRAADEAAAGRALGTDTWARLADDIAELIGHSVTDQPRAAELDGLLADEEPVRTWHSGHRSGTRGYFEDGAKARRVREAVGKVPWRHPFSPEVGRSAPRIGDKPAPVWGSGDCDVTLPHLLGEGWPVPPFDAAGHPPGCPAYAGKAPNLGHPRAQVMHAPTSQEGKSGEPAAPADVLEGPRSRAIRLDAEARDAGAAYRAKLQAADEAWRLIGGRP